MLNVIIFDLDGVLIDSEPLMRFAFNACYRQVVGEGTPPIEEFLEHMGESLPHIMQALDLPETLCSSYRALCQQHIGRIHLFPECLQVLTWARAQRISLAILTAKDKQRTHQILEYFGLEHFFHEVVSSDQLTAPKPDPEGILRILRAIGCQPGEAVMIGDAVSDIACGQSAGVYSIAVTWGIKPERVQTLCRPDAIVQTWQDLLLHLQMLAYTRQEQRMSSSAFSS